MKCLTCGRELIKNQAKFCSCSCAAKYNNTNRKTTTKGREKIVQCIGCNRDIAVSIHASHYSWMCEECRDNLICPYCNKKLRNKSSLTQHIRFCKDNPNHEVSLGNHNNMPIHKRAYYEKPMIFNHIQLDITKSQFEHYQQHQTTCEICGKTIDEAIVKQHKYKAKHFCLDHDHHTNRFRGLLCSCCNRQLGWYEKYKEQINSYLDQDFTERNQNLENGLFVHR